MNSMLPDFKYETESLKDLFFCYLHREYTRVSRLNPDAGNNCAPSTPS